MHVKLVGFKILLYRYKKLIKLDRLGLIVFEHRYKQIMSIIKIKVYLNGDETENWIASRSDAISADFT